MSQTAYALNVFVLAALGGVLAWAALSDLLKRRIPNAAVLGVIVIFAVCTLLRHGAGFAENLAAGALCLVVTFGLSTMRVIGAGDAKLFAALALFSGFSHLASFVFWTVLLGAGLALIDIAARRLRGASSRPDDRGGRRGVPYGVAIVLAGAHSAWATVLITPSPPL